MRAGRCCGRVARTSGRGSPTSSRRTVRHTQIIEIMELNDVTTGMATFVRDAAANWDGSDPIRVLGG